MRPRSLPLIRPNLKKSAQNTVKDAPRCPRNAPDGQEHTPIPPKTSYAKLQHEAIQAVLDEQEPNPKRRSAAHRKREHDAWLESLQISQNAPPITEAVILRSMKHGGPWRPIAILAQDVEEQHRREERERVSCELYEIPLPEFSKEPA